MYRIRQETIFKVDEQKKTFIINNVFSVPKENSISDLFNHIKNSEGRTIQIAYKLGQDKPVCITVNDRDVWHTEHPHGEIILEKLPIGRGFY